MADKYFTNSAGGAIATGANWSGGTVPAAGDNVIIPANIGGAITGGDISANKAAYFEVEDGYRFDLGSSGSRCQISADKMVHRGHGKFWLTNKTAVMPLLVLESPSLDALDVNDDGANAITKIAVFKGGVNVTTSQTIARFDMGGNQSKMVLDTSAGAITAFSQAGGIATLKRAVTNGYLFGGECTVDDTAGNATFSTLLAMGGSSRVLYKSGTTLALALVMGGLIDFSVGYKVLTVSDIRVLLPGTYAEGSRKITFTAGSFQAGTKVQGLSGV